MVAPDEPVMPSEPPPAAPRPRAAPPPIPVHRRLLRFSHGAWPLLAWLAAAAGAAYLYKGPASTGEAYAYADVNLAPPASITVTNLFIASGNAWVSINRVQPCAGGSGNPIPAAIWQQACASN